MPNYNEVGEKDLKRKARKRPAKNTDKSPESDVEPVVDLAPEPFVAKSIESAAEVAVIKRRFVLRIVIVVITLALWKGWAQENHFLANQIQNESQLVQSGSTPNYEPSWSRHVVEVSERENRYQERESGQPWKLIPMILATVLAGFLVTAPKAKAYLDRTVSYFMNLKGSMKLPIAVVAFCGIIGSFMICGHANTGAFTGVALGSYIFWLGKQREAQKGPAVATPLGGVGANAA